MPNDITEIPTEKSSSNLPHKWQLDKSINLSMVLAIIAQALIFVYLIGMNAEKITEHDKRFDRLDVYVTEHTKTLNDLSNHIASLDAKMSILLDTLAAQRQDQPAHHGGK